MTLLQLFQKYLELENRIINNERNLICTASLPADHFFLIALKFKVKTYLISALKDVEVVEFFDFNNEELQILQETSI